MFEKLERMQKVLEEVEKKELMGQLDVFDPAEKERRTKSLSWKLAAFRP